MEEVAEDEGGDGRTGRAFPQENISPSTTIEPVRKPQAATSLSGVTEYFQTRSSTHQSHTHTHSSQPGRARTVNTLHDDLVLKH